MKNSSRFSSCSAARPNVTIKAEMLRRGGNEFWVVSCISSGGRPDTDISLALSSDEELERENVTDSDVQRSSVFLPAAEYEGHNVTCVFGHPKFTQVQSRAVTLPSFCEYRQCLEELCWCSWGRSSPQIFCLIHRFDWSSVVELEKQQLQWRLGTHWKFRAAGRREWGGHRPRGRWESATLQYHLQEVSGRLKGALDMEIIPWFLEGYLNF